MNEKATQARTVAIDKTLAELKEKFEQGQIEAGQYFRLKTYWEQKKIELGFEPPVSPPSPGCGGRIGQWVFMLQKLSAGARIALLVMLTTIAVILLGIIIGLPRQAALIPTPTRFSASPTAMATITSVPVSLATPTLTPAPTDLNSDKALIIIVKLEDRSNGGHQGTNPAQSLYTQTINQAQEDGLALDIQHLEQMPDESMLKKIGEIDQPILILSGWYDTVKVTFNVDLFTVLSPSGLVEKTDKFSGIVELNHAKYLALFVLGIEEYVNGSYDMSLGYFNNVLTSIPDDNLITNLGEAYYFRGLIYHARGDYQRAVFEYTQAIKFEPEDIAEIYNSRGAAYDDSGKYADAIDSYNKAIQIQPNSARFYQNRGNAYAHWVKYDLAIADYTQSIKTQPDDAVAYYDRGNVYSDMGDNQRALADYTQAIQIDPEYIDAYINRGISYFNLDDINHAIVDYDHAIQLDPNNGSAYNNRGNAYRRKGSYDLAIADLDKAIELDPGDYAAYYNRGLAYEGKGDIKKAIDDYRKVLSLNPSPDAKNRAEQRLGQLAP
jgi:tetratricopeptide (TPR) repeat protein